MQQAFTPKKHGLFSKLIFALFLAILSIAAQAQTEIVTAKSYLTQNAIQQKLTTSDIDQMVVSSSYLSPTTGWYHVYFNQTHQSVEVYNGLLNLTLKGGKVEYVTNSFIADIAAKTNIKLENLTLSPVQALQQAALNVNLTASSLDQIKEVKKTQLPNGLVEKVTYTDNNLSNENIEVKLYWLQYEAQEGEKTAQKIALTWNVRFLTKDHQNSWNIHVDALSGGVVEKRDDVIRCSFGAPHQHNAAGVCAMGMLPQARAAAAATLAANSYNVFDYPVESPNHGTRSIVSNPYDRFLPLGTGPGTTNGWHNDGTTHYTTTRGNNVWAKEDIANDDEITIGTSPVSATLDFDYPYTAGNNVASRDAAITNLFYWNNLIHDVLWKYGFDEPSGNFQNDNQGRGGAGNDFVFADAQDGAEVNNANFNTPVDGGNGRMQMFLWTTAGAPDGDFDNGIIAHEYGHGWSIRLTGGPANSSCLRNAEQGGEGWSDYLTLMLTTPWSTLMPNVASANIPRGIGTYALAQATTGPGIRPYRYSYDMANVNAPVTYAKVGDAVNFSQPHGIGSIWATMLWDMTWEIILQDNFIDPNIYNTPANILDMKGNVAALKLVNEGLRLQPCSPSFVQARDAILQADQMLFGGRYRCAIGKAFARRGLGLYASTGASTNDRTVTEDFTPIPSLSTILSSPLNPAAICSNNSFSYVATAPSNTTSYSWSRPVVAGISNAAGSGNSATINEALINTTANPITVKYLFTLSEDVCASLQTVSVVVNPSVTPTVGTYSICQNAMVPQGEGLVAPPAYGTKVSGTLTIASPTYQRGQGNNTTTYTASSTGSNVYYQTFTFVAPSSGNVTFETVDIALTNSPNSSIYDTYMTLYQTSFNPASPATNFLRGDDDSGTLQYASKFTHNLVQGTTYIIVISTFNNGVTGTFSVQSSVPVFTGTNNWYKNASGGVSLATGEVFNPVGVAGSGIPNTATPGSHTFYLATDAFPDCRTPVTFNINPNHTISLTSLPATETQAVCVNSPINDITYSLGGGATGVDVTGLPTGVTSSLNSGVLTISGTPSVTAGSPFGYNIVTTGNTCTTATESGTITVNSLPTAPVVTGGATICVGGSATLTATGCSGAGLVLKWYKATDNAEVMMPVSPTVTTQYYAKCEQTLNNVTCASTVSSYTSVIVLSPATPVATGATICVGGSATLTATGCVGSGLVLKWYQTADNSAVSMPVSPTVTTQYYAKCEQTLNNVTCASAASGNVTVTVLSPVAPVATGATICAGGTATLIATGCVGSGLVLKWYQTADNSAVSMPVSPTVTTQYYAKCEQTLNNVTCVSAASGNVSVTVLNPSAPVATGATICVGGSATLTATGCVGTGLALKWYKTADNSAVSMPVSPTVNTQYYAKCEQTLNNVTCASAASGNVSVTVLNPSAPVATGATICVGGSATLTATGCVGTGLALKWYKTADNSAVSMPVSPTVNTQYYAKCEQTYSDPMCFACVQPQGTIVCLSPASGNVSVTVLNPVAPVATGATICAGGSATLTATGCAGADLALKWYKTADNSAVSMPVSPTVNTQYYAKCEQTLNNVTCASAASGNVTVTVLNPSAPVATGATICVGGTATLTATGCVGTDLALKWYKTADNSAVSMPVSPTVNTQYYAKCEQTLNNVTCASTASGNVTVTVLNPSAPVATGATICVGGSATLTATGCSGAGLVLKWYKTSDNAEVMMPVSPTVNTQYYAKCEQTLNNVTCISTASGNVSVMVLNPSAPVATGATICVGGSATLTATGCSGAGLVLKWYKTSDNAEVMMPVSPTVNTQYYAKCEQTLNNVTCISTASGNVSVMVLNPSAPVATGATICVGGTATLTATGCVGTGLALKWYKTADNAEVMMPVSPTVTTQYYAKCEQTLNNVTCASTSSGNVSVTVNPLPTASISGTTAVCQNAPFPTVTFSGNGGTKPYVFTYKINAGGNLTVATTGVNSDVTVTQTTAAAGVFNYSLVSVKDANGCEQLQNGVVVITVHAPPVVSVAQASLCTGLTMTLSPTSGGTWQSSNPMIATVNNAGVVTAIMAGSVNFTFTQTSTGCSSTTSNVTIKPTPSSNLTASKVDVCANTEVSLNPNCSIPTSTVNWNPGGPTVTPAAATLPYVYRARCEADGCVGNETSVEVRTHRILVDMKDLDVGALPLPIVRAVKDNMAPTNLIQAPVFPRRWTFIANGCDASESAEFKLSGPVLFNTIDNTSTYAMFANEGNRFYSLDHPNYGNGGSFPDGTYTLTINLRSKDGVSGPYPKNRVATGTLLATRTLEFTVGNSSLRQGVGELETEFMEENWISLLQNPVNEEIVVRLSGKVGEEIELALVNMQGQSIQQRGLKLSSVEQSEVFNIRKSSSGLYILKAIKGNKVKTIKVVKID